MEGGRSGVKGCLVRILSMANIVYVIKEVKDIYMTIAVAHVL